MNKQEDLLEQLVLPVKEKAASYDIRVPLRVLTFMFTMAEIVNEASFYLRDKKRRDNHQRDCDEVRKTRRKLAEKLKGINYSFVATHEKIESLIKIIIRIRTQELVEKIKAEQYLWKLNNNDPNKHYFILKQLYMKTFRIRNYILYNEKRMASISSVHEILITKLAANLRLGEIDTQFIEQSSLEDRLERTKRDLEYEWTRQKGKGKKALLQIRQLGELVDLTEISNKAKLGIWMGIMVFMSCTVVFLIVNYDINFKSYHQFEETFPIWRGVWYFIWLFWLFGVQSYVFETFGISFRMLTMINNFYIPKYPTLFVCAAFFTSVHLLMFMLYIFALAQFGIAFPQNFELHYLPAVSWILLLVVFCTPLPFFHFHKRMYPLFMLIRSLFSPIFGIEFKFHWWTEIWISFRQPFRDLCFTLIFYFVDSDVEYEKTIIFETIAGIAIYSLRIVQNIRQMHQAKVWGGMPFFGSIKCTLNIITMVTSYLFRIEEGTLSMAPLIFWIISAICSSSYAYHFDLKWDWGLLQNNKYLRKQLIYGSKNLYYSIIILNLLFRFVWVLNISPDILSVIPLQPYFLIMVISSIEILRRNCWSILRIEKQHIIAEKYYDSLGITRNKEEEKHEVAHDQLLVEVEHLNETFSMENEKEMKKIYEECEQEILSPTRLKKRITREKEFFNLDYEFRLNNVRKSDLLETLGEEIRDAHENFDRILIEIKSFLKEVDQEGGTILDFDSDRYELNEFD